MYRWIFGGRRESCSGSGGSWFPLYASAYLRGGTGTMSEEALLWIQRAMPILVLAIVAAYAYLACKRQRANPN